MRSLSKRISISRLEVSLDYWSYLRVTFNRPKRETRLKSHLNIMADSYSEAVMRGNQNGVSSHALILIAT